MATRTTNPVIELLRYGQSVWYDNISRELLMNGELKRMIDEWGLRGLTSNPTIFDKAISGSFYDQTIAKLKNLSPEKIFEKLAIEDIGQAADLLLPLYKESNGNDGFVSIEVSPLLARNTVGTIEEAVRIHQELSRPNVLVKVPGTKEGLPAIQALLEKGMNINITLLFSVENYIEVAKVYCEALRARIRQGLPIAQIRSVASFFVSRVDTSADNQLQNLITKEKEKNPAKAELAQSLLGRFGIANSKIAYKRFQEIFEGVSFSDLQPRNAAVQRPLWASTGTKNPAYRDVVYVEQLIGPHTVNTMPHETLVAFLDHGAVSETLVTDLKEAEVVPQRLLELGIDPKKIVDDLQVEGVKKFSDSYQALIKTISERVRQC